MSNWFSYEWEVQGLPAEIHVDLQYAPEPELLSGHTTLIYLTCATKGNRLSFLDRKLLDKILSKSLRIIGDDARYVGFVDLPNQRRFYFYVSDGRILVPLSEYCASVSALQLQCSRYEEPDFNTYYFFLFPDDAKFQSYNNAKYIESMEKNGDDTSVPRRVTLYFCFPSLGTASPFLEEAKRLGFALGNIDCNEAYELPCSISLHKISPLEKNALRKLTSDAIITAQKYSGVISRLDSEFVPKNLLR